jgi:transposase
MFTLGNQHKFYYYLDAVDMRKGFNGLSGLVSESLDLDSRQEQVYVFVNKRRDKVKLLHWSFGGFTLYYKRLERGVFELPGYDIIEGMAQLSYTEMIMLIDGISIVNTKKIERYLPT